MAVKKLAKKKTVAAKAMKKGSAKVVKKTKAPTLMSKKTGPVTKAYTKTEILGDIAMVTGLAQKQVGAVLENLQNVIARHLRKGAAGVFVLPGLLKIQVINKPATKARKGINPFTGLETMFKAKPARNVVKVKALKKLKSMV